METPPLSLLSFYCSCSCTWWWPILLPFFPFILLGAGLKIKISSSRLLTSKSTSSHSIVSSIHSRPSFSPAWSCHLHTFTLSRLRAETPNRRNCLDFIITSPCRVLPNHIQFCSRVSSNLHVPSKHSTLVYVLTHFQYERQYSTRSSIQLPTTSPRRTRLRLR